MEDLSKTRYLVGSGADQKLKRNIPERLQCLAGKTAWVERIPHMAPAQAKQRANLFAVRTDGALRRLEDFLKAQIVAAPDATVPINLDSTRARQIAIAYRDTRHRQNIESGGYFLSPDDRDFSQLILTAWEDVDEALAEASGERRTTDRRAVKLLAEQGVISAAKAEALLASGWPDELSQHSAFQLLCRWMEAIDLQLANARRQSWETGNLPIIDSSVPLGLLHGSDRGSISLPGAINKTIGDLKTEFLGHWGAKVSRSRLKQAEIPFRVLEEQLGPRLELSSIGREDARRIAAFLPRIPPYVTQHHKGLSLAAAAERYEKAHSTSADRFKEASKHLQVIQQAFSFGVSEGWLEKSPWTGLTIDVPAAQRRKHLDKEATYEPFSTDELKRLFALPLFLGCADDERGCHTPGPNLVRRHRYWAPILALWTGMRMNEILQLEKEDFECTDGGVAYVSITDKQHVEIEGGAAFKRVKTGNAIRDIPLHPMLSRLGFIKWLDAQPSGRLFPEATLGAGEKLSDQYSKRFRSNLKAAGIWNARRKVFHSLRNNFNDALRDAGVSEEFRKAINGWQGQNSMDQRYGRGHKVDSLFTEISKVQYPGFSMEELLAAARTRGLL